MPRFPIVSAKKLIKVLGGEGFVVARQEGSHIILKKKIAGGYLTTVVPNHREIALGTLRSILRRAEISLDRLRELL